MYTVQSKCSGLQCEAFDCDGDIIREKDQVSNTLALPV